MTPSTSPHNEKEDVCGSGVMLENANNEATSNGGPQMSDKEVAMEKKYAGS